jgi:hypothetical protein
VYTIALSLPGLDLRIRKTKNEFGLQEIFFKKESCAAMPEKSERKKKSAQSSS